MAFAACGDSSVVPEDRVARIEVTPTHAALALPGEQMAFSAALFDAEGRTVTGERVLWSSSDEAVATVGSAGIVVGTGAGSATIMASVAGVQGIAALVVDPDVAPPELRSVEVDKSRVNVLNQAGLVRVTAALTDDRAGVASVLAQFQGPAGASITGLVTFQLVEGTPTEGSYLGFLTVPANTSVGTWVLALMQAEDTQGNISVWRPDDLRAMGLDVTFEVVWGGGQ